MPFGMCFESDCELRRIGLQRNIIRIKECLCSSHILGDHREPVTLAGCDRERAARRAFCASIDAADSIDVHAVCGVHLFRGPGKLYIHWPLVNASHSHWPVHGDRAVRLVRAAP